MTKRQDLCLQRRSPPEQSDQRQANQPANISHQPRASPDSTSLASRIEFPTMTELRLPQDTADRATYRLFSQHWGCGRDRLHADAAIGVSYRDATGMNTMTPTRHH